MIFHSSLCRLARLVPAVLSLTLLGGCTRALVFGYDADACTEKMATGETAIRVGTTVHAEYYASHSGGMESGPVACSDASIVVSDPSVVGLRGGAGREIQGPQGEGYTRGVLLTGLRPGTVTIAIECNSLEESYVLHVLEAAQ